MRVSVAAKLKVPSDIMEGLGVSERGKVQQFMTDRTLFRMRPYMPYLTGAMVDSQTMVTGPTTITVAAPYAQYVYNGVSRSGNELTYTKEPHPLAGPRWDEAMIQAEGDALLEEVCEYSRSLNGRRS
ncbi:minor capsid protein [Adlercreutzia caecimuris]|uniref:minor capsid protein n=1 Tax=Adlercreutzia caecimuris TaxID=671266 RepID=UPI0034E3AD04